MDRRAIKGINDLLQVAKEVKRQENVVYTLVKTKVHKSHSKMQKAINEYVKKSGYHVATTEIRVSELYKQATENHRPSPLYAFNERPHEDYLSLTHEIIKRVEEIS